MLIIGYERFCSSLSGRFSFNCVSVYSTVRVLEREREQYILLLLIFFYFIVLFFCVCDSAFKDL